MTPTLVGSILDDLPAPAVDRERWIPNRWHVDSPRTLYRERMWNPAGYVVIATEVDVNPGPSITNTAETVHADITRRWPDALVVEHYRRGINWHSTRGPETFDLITIAGDGQPCWHPLTGNVIRALVTG